ncbi:MAG: TauD/TfdA family dioxygenase [Pseudomonadota bacterium]|nr:TauD/TfdA family dioxygenase [Pseudomonadota bacterium]
MSQILTEPITGPAAWRGADIAQDAAQWTRRLSPEAIATIDAALATLKARGKAFPHFDKQDFPIDALAPELREWAEVLENGLGFLLVRGLPVTRYSDADIQAVYYGIGLHLGTPVRQNPRGDLLGEVMAVGDVTDRNTRVYQTNLYLPYHTDPSDVVGLLCLRQAREGGVSSLVSVATLHNTLLATRPHLMGLYYRAWYYAHMGEDLPSLSPLFSHHQGKLACRYLRQYIELGHDIRQLPLSRVEIEALDAFDAVMQDPAARLDMMLAPGDLQWANNYAVLHSRTAFIDHEAPAQRRRMLRLWLKMDNARALAPDFPGRNGFPASAVPA